MITYSEAIEIIIREGRARSLDMEAVSLQDMAGRICAEDVISSIANQPFDNSAMDGFALNADDLSMAVNDNPVAMDVIGRISAGEGAQFKAPAQGQCYEIMTGAPLPSGCDVVVTVENTEREDNKILFRAAPRKNGNIRRAGEDYRAGDAVLSAGARLEVQHVLPLATLGVGQVNVLHKPKIALISTGLEVVDDLDCSLKSGQIYNSTGPYLKAVLPVMGAETFSCGTVADDPEEFKNKLACMVKHKVDIAVSTGAVSAGVHDFIRSALEDMGAEILFHKVKNRPGKPILFAKLPDGGPLFVGLPGNPVASAAGLRFFVYPLIRAMQGLDVEQPQKVVLKGNYSKKKTDFRFFLRAVLKGAELEILQKQQSFMVSSFVHANGWAVAPEGVNDMKTGDVIDFYPMMPF